MSIRSNLVESTTFSTNRLDSPVALYFLSLARIDFRHIESTFLKQRRFVSIPSKRVHESTSGKSNRECQGVC